MAVNDVTLDERCIWGGACARCSQPVVDVYHSPYWLELMSAAARGERGIAVEAVSGAKDADGAC